MSIIIPKPRVDERHSYGIYDQPEISDYEQHAELILHIFLNLHCPGCFHLFLFLFKLNFDV